MSELESSSGEAQGMVVGSDGSLIPAEFALRGSIVGADCQEISSFVMDARIPEPNFSIVNAELIRRGQQPITQITAERVAQIRNSPPIQWNRERPFTKLGGAMRRLLRLTE